MTDNKSTGVSVEIGGKPLELSPGNFALQADGSAICRVGDTMVHATFVASGEPRGEVDYLPLMVDYEEKLYAAGKIKGSRWVKREGRPSDEAILRGRVIDRSIRPMFDDRIRNDLQLVVTVLSADGQNDPDILGLNAAAAAIELSSVPWEGPIAGVRVGKINDALVINPSFEQMEKNGMLDLVVSGTKDHIIMVEAGASEVSEEEIIKAVSLGHEHIKKIIGAIKELRENSGKEKKDFQVFEPETAVAEKVESFKEKLQELVFSNISRLEKTKELSRFQNQVIEEAAGDDEELKKQAAFAYSKMLKKMVQEAVLQEEKRIDGRALSELRELDAQVALLPRVHGSGLFRRGETQVLTTLTVGGPGDEQILEDIETEEERKKRYIHHYNFPAFSVGEVRPIRSPGRREIGHGALAERALMPVLPSKENFPYVMRLVSEVMSSNGSTSMASTCGSTLALMDGGIPIKAPISGVAMGLIMDETNGKYKILTDIQGAEDANGHMDFKVTGSKEGVTALQLDIKVKGLTVEILTDALSAAKEGRLKILEKMLAAIPEPRKEMSQYAPRVYSMQIDPDKIRTVIGPGGKTINQIIDQTGVKIDIEDDGMVMITSTNQEASTKAIEWIQNLTREVKVGENFNGVITRIMDFGAFAEVLPGQEGLIHISELAHERVEKVTDVVKVGDVVPVKVIEIDNMGRINLSRKALLEGGSAMDRRDRPASTGRPPRNNSRDRRGGGLRRHGNNHRPRH